jgi:hypothetical protein
MKISRSRLSARVGFTALAVGLAFGVCTSAMAQWKWRDSNNRVQYSDLPPPATVPESSILQRPAGATRRAPPQFSVDPASAASAPEAQASGPATTTDGELEAKRKKAEQDKAAARKADDAKVAAARADSCNRAKAYQKSLDEGQRMARVNAAGEREVYDDKIRAEESKRTREIIASDCK